MFFIHESSYIEEDVKIGPGTKIWHFCHLMKDCKIGRDCSIGQNVFISSGVVLGDGVKVQNNVSLFTGVICEDSVFLGPSVVFTNVINPQSFIERKDEYRSTLIKTGATVGANATIVCGCTIGAYALIGAGSVVTRDVPDYALSYGNPARIRGWVCRCGEKIDFSVNQTQCQVCGLLYVKVSDHQVISKE